MREAYIVRDYFHKKSLRLIALSDEIVTEFSKLGFRLTLRQLYYQLVARGHIENTMRSYDNLGNVINDARLCGLIDWDAIEDRTRGVNEQLRWQNGKHILEMCSKQYHQDMWADQEHRVFLIVEKEALAGILEPTCLKWDIPLLSARGYPSVTTLREMAKYRLMPCPQEIVVIHLGDHDPSGIDMSRDLEERLSLLSREQVYIDFRRLALNMDQVKSQKPPPNPAKQSDSRFKLYSRKFGDQSWELDALSPKFIHDLVEKEVSELIDHELWEAKQEEIEAVKKRLASLAKNFNRKRKGKK